MTNAAQVGDEVFPWVNEHLNANTQVGIAARIVSRWSQDWHREQYDPEVYKHHENDILDLRDTITSLLAERDQLRETLAFAAQYKGIEARACPLCVYENGKFVEACQMHKDMDALRQQLDTAAHNNSVLNAKIVALQGQVTEMAGWETVPEGVYPCDCTVDDCKRSLGVQHRAGGGIRLILRDGTSIKAYVVQDDMRLQRRTESEGE